MTLEDFEQKVHFGQSFDIDTDTKGTMVSMRTWYNPTGNEITRLVILNPPEKMKDPDFYNSEEWGKVKPKYMELSYQLYLLSQKEL